MLQENPGYLEYLDLLLFLGFLKDQGDLGCQYPVNLGLPSDQLGQESHHGQVVLSLPLDLEAQGDLRHLEDQEVQQDQEDPENHRHPLDQEFQEYL